MPSQTNITLYFCDNIVCINRWNPLPLSKTLNILMYGEKVGNINLSYGFAKEVGLPEIIHGYWKVINDKSAMTSPLIDFENNELDYLKSIRSFDFSLAIFDTSNCVLFLFKINT